MGHGAAALGLVVRLIPVWVWWAIIAALAALLGVQTVRAARIKTAFAEYRAEGLRLVAEAEKRERAKEREWGGKIEEVRNDANREKESLQGDIADAVRTADGMREQRDALARRARAQACTTGRSADQPGGDPIGVLAELSARADALAEIYARTADRRAIIARACERSGDALER